MNRTRSPYLPAFVVALSLVPHVALASSSRLITIESFSGDESAWPIGALAFDGEFLYGTTQGEYPGHGTVYRAAIDGSGLTTLHTFELTEGFNPYAGVSLIDSRLFGVTFRGGPAVRSLIGDGTVFSLNPDGSDYRLLKTFGYLHGTTSVRPRAPLIAEGNTLFGTTAGQSSDHGSVFRINSDGTAYQTIHSFNGMDGDFPVTKLSLINEKLYGMTGGYSFENFNGGTIFSLGKDGSSFEVLHTFSRIDGNHPQGPLTLVGSRLYGVTVEGGSRNRGTIFSINLDGSDFKSLHAFALGVGGNTPQSGLTLCDGRLYGTTVYGGYADVGTIFSILPDGTGFQVEYSFSGDDGVYPLSTLLADGSTLFGTTERGGDHGWGTLFAFRVPEPSSVLEFTIITIGLPFVLVRARVNQPNRCAS